MTRQLKRLLALQGLPARGLVHAGAHHGGELANYLECGFSPILMIEANPAAYPVLQRHVEGQTGGSRLQAIQRAVWDAPGQLYLQRTQFETQSSLLVPQGPIMTVDRVPVECATLDAILLEAAIQPTEINVLVLDIQGAELRAMRACPQFLRGLDLIVCEVNDEPRYQDCPLLGEVDELMNWLGFFRWLRSGPFPGCLAGDAVYLNVNAQPFPWT